MKKIFVYIHVGCERRPLDARRIVEYFTRNGHIIVEKPDDAEIIFFITCGAFKFNADITFKLIKKFQKYDAELIIAGCLPAIETEELAKIFNGRTIITKDLDNMDSLFPENKIKFKEIGDANIYYKNMNVDDISSAFRKILRKSKILGKIYKKIFEHVFKNLFGEKSLFYMILSPIPNYCIRVTWGCSSNCSYCVIKHAIGRTKSKPLIDCISELKEGLRKGYKRFLLTGDDVGPYGLDIDSNLVELLDEITKISGEFTISIRAFGPQHVVKYIDELEKIIKRGKINRIDINIQTGSKRIAKLMHRYPDFDKVEDAIKRIKKSYPGIEIFTHIIIGFPSETEEEFNQSLNSVIDMDIDAGAFFQYSTRPGIDSDKIEPKVSQKEIKNRVKHAKHFLKNQGYNTVYKSKSYILLFEKKQN